MLALSVPSQAGEAGDPLARRDSTARVGRSRRTRSLLFGTGETHSHCSMREMKRFELTVPFCVSRTISPSGGQKLLDLSSISDFSEESRRSEQKRRRDRERSRNRSLLRLTVCSDAKMEP